jgi:hypothetical protein
MRQPNDSLSSLIGEAGISWAGLARRVNDLGATIGLGLRYDYTAVNRWVKRGESPRPPVATLIAGALSEKLGRKIDPSDFGMQGDEPLAERGLRYADNPDLTMGTIAELGKADLQRRHAVLAPFILGALGGPSRDWLLASLDETATERGPRQIGLRQVAGIRNMFAIFQEMDVMKGGGHARATLADYMVSYVYPLLKRDHPEPVRLALMEAAAEQTYLLGWMAYDDGEHGLAERYLIQALSLSRAVPGASALGAHILAGLSDQVNLLGHPREALQLARAGRQGLSEGDSPACTADLYVLEGRALAALGEHRAASIAVANAERIFGHVVTENEPEWARFIDRSYLFGEAAHCFRDLGNLQEIDRFAGESITVANEQGRARRGALSHAALAIAELGRKNVEGAAAKALTVVRLSSAVNSSRCIEAVRDLQARFRPSARVESVQRFNAEAEEMLGLTA